MQITRDLNIPEGFVALAKITGVFGIRGELRVFLFNPESTLLRQWRAGYLWDGENQPSTIRVRTRSGAGKKVIGKIEHVSTPEDARALMGQLILYEKNRLPKPVSDEWYHHEIIGMAVHTASGEYIGKIVEIVPGQVDIWVAEGNGLVIHIPNTKEDILSVERENGVVVPDEDSEIGMSGDDED